MSRVQRPVLPADAQAADRSPVQPQDERPHRLQRAADVPLHGLGHGLLHSHASLSVGHSVVRRSIVNVIVIIINVL